MKLCVDCKHLLIVRGRDCCELTERIVTLVTGEKTYAKCENERTSGACGKDGKRWEAKQ